MTKTDSGVEVGRLGDRVEVRELLKTTGEAGTAYTWETARRTWTQPGPMSTRSTAWGRQE